MTMQTSVDMITPASASLPIPRQRAAAHSARPTEPLTPSLHVDTAAPSIRRRAGWPSAAIDTSLALAIGATAAMLGVLTTQVAVVGALSWPVLLLAAGQYRHRAMGESRLTGMRTVALTGVRALVVMLALTPWLATNDPLDGAMLVAGFSVASGVHQLLRVRRRRLRLVLTGRPRDVREALLELMAADTLDVVAVCLTRTSRMPFGLPTYVGFDSSSGVADQHRADALVVLPGARMTPTAMRRLHWDLAGVGTELCVGTGLLDVTPDRTRVFATGGLNLVHVAPASLTGPRRWAKDVIERVTAAAALALLLPVLLALGVAIRQETPGPALYRQTRVGKDGRHFTMVKFRSMSASAETERIELLSCNEADGVLFKIQQDPRITRLGRGLRRWSIDEVPQLWNVVRGDMSLVGPRPALPEEVAKYDVDPTRRLVVKPGLTGLWQVSGRSDLTWAESVRLDVRYVDNWSLRLDAHILLRTVRAVLGHRGAY